MSCAGNALPASRSCLISCPGGTRLEGSPSAPLCGPCDGGQSCGSDCAPCPTPPPGGRESCTGNSQPSSQSCTLTCGAGYQLAGGTCQGCLSVQSCGSNCQPCPNGGATYLCSGNASPAATACIVSSCPSGQHEVSGACQPCGSISSCGSDCQSCPGAPLHGSYACAGNGSPAATACQLDCAAGFILNGQSCLCPSPSQSAGADGGFTLFVDAAKGNDGTGNGSAVCPFATATQAISAASLAAQQSGAPQVAWIDLAAGSYTQETFPLTLTTPTILQGAAPGSTTLLYPGTGLAVWLSSQGAGLANLTLAGAGSNSSIGVEVFWCGQSITGTTITGFARGVHEWLTSGVTPCTIIDSNSFTGNTVGIQLEGSSAQITQNRFTGGGISIQDELGSGSFPVLLSGNSFSAGNQSQIVCPQPDIGFSCCGGNDGGPVAAQPSGVAICINGTSGATLDSSLAPNQVTGSVAGLVFQSNGGTTNPGDAGPVTQPTVVSGSAFTSNSSYGVFIGSGGQLWALDLGSNASAGGNSFSCNGLTDVAIGAGQSGTLAAENDLWDHSPPRRTASCSSGVDVCTGGGSAVLQLTGSAVVPSPCL